MVVGFLVNNVVVVMVMVVFGIWFIFMFMFLSGVFVILIYLLF